MLQEVLQHSDMTDEDGFYLRSSADTLWKFLKTKNKSISTCIQLSGVCVVPLGSSQRAAKGSATNLSSKKSK